VWEIGEKNAVSPKNMPHLAEYYGSLAVLEEGNPLFMLLDALCERMWDSPAFSILEINGLAAQKDYSIAQILDSSAAESDRVGMKTLEQRYEFENEMILAVSQGQLHKEKQLLSAFSDSAFENRISDRVRNAKNYSIIMNTLLRKAAERGGVHPYYIDKLSSDFAAKIERMSHLSENSELMREMFRSYCRLVRRHATKNLSVVVQKAKLLIDSDLSANLSLKTVAENQNVSLGYLSDVFKRETGKTVTEYIRERRIEHAKYLLGTTQLQIQTVALHCGIVDVHYFSKIFKKETGKTPKEFRKAHE
jgi:AraC-like DNA-binding protein